MKGLLLIALLVAGSNTVAGMARRRLTTDSSRLSKPDRKIISRRDPMFGHLIGRTKSEVLTIKGEPAEKTADAWVYRQRLGPGAHSFRYSWVFKFKSDKVFEIEEKREAVGCILVPFPRDW